MNWAGWVQDGAQASGFFHTSLIGALQASPEAAAAAVPAKFLIAQGAIVGALLIGAAVLAAAARGRAIPVAIAGVLLATAAGFEASVFGLAGLAAHGPIFLFFEGALAAAALIYVGATVHSARENPLLGALLLLGALGAAGLGIAGATGFEGVEPFLRFGLVGVSIFILILSLIQAFAGDRAARALIPGVVLVVAAIGAAFWAGAAGENAWTVRILPHALFAMGVIACAIVSIGAPPVDEVTIATTAPGAVALATAASSAAQQQSAPAPAVLADEQLAQVLDYSGLGVWDWDAAQGYSRLSPALRKLLNAAHGSRFDQGDMRAMIHHQDRHLYEDAVFGGETPQDGRFDEWLRLRDGRLVRFRGARAVAPDGAPERVVAFVEPAALPPGEADAAPVLAPVPGEAHKAEPAAAPDLTETASAPVLAGVAGDDSPIAHIAPEEDAAAPVAEEEETRKAEASAEDAAVDGTPEQGDAEDGDRAAQGAALAASLRAAITAGEVAPFYQPIIRLADGDVAGFEALARWTRPDGSVVEPAEFIGHAETGALGAALSGVMLERAAEDLSRWREKFGPIDFYVAVNLSSGLLSSEDVVTAAIDAVASRGLPPGSMRIEITESQLMADPERAGEAIARLKEAGFTIAVDDFGTGFSSLSYLQKFDLDALKIDKSFVSALADDADAAKITRSIVDLAHDLNLTVIAEGAESEESARRLRSMGCEYAQGFVFGAAMNVQDAEQFLRLYAPRAEATA